ncbi:MAG: hypothetical protein KC912_15675 [Proteobacteria bacterium]|nr:hypothetical protein [Pseudomonadota bacterium]
MRTLVPVLIFALSGCTAIKSSVHLVQAEQAVTRAEQRNADDDAIYEYTMSLRYLEKAREENGYSDYKDSTTLSKAAVEWAEQAVSAVEMGGSTYRPTAPAEADDESIPEETDDVEVIDESLPDLGDDDLPEDLLEDE